MSVACRFVDFATGRFSIVTAPGPGRPAQVKVLVKPLMPSIGPKTASAKNAGKTADMCPEDAGRTEPGGRPLRSASITRAASLWPRVDSEGSLGGAERIVVGQLAGTGAVKVFSSGSALQGGPAMYLAPADHSPIGFGEMASFTPFDGGAGVTVATRARRTAPTCW